MSSAGREENSPGRGQSPFRLASPSGQTDLHWCLANRNHEYSWCRELKHFLGREVQQHRAHKAQPPHSRAGCSFCSCGQWATRACMPTGDNAFALCGAHRSRGGTLPCIHRGKRRPGFISHLSLFLWHWFTCLFSDQLFLSDLGPMVNPIYKEM